MSSQSVLDMLKSKKQLVPRNNDKKRLSIELHACTRPVKLDSKSNDSYELVLFSESKALSATSEVRFKKK